MAVIVTLHQTINICSIYIPPRSKIVEKDLDEIVNQLPTPFLLLKDLISDFYLTTAAGVVPCGGRKTSPRTSTIVQFIFYFGPLRSAIIF